ncbi:sialate O-acetylesterase [Blastopirellula marina]|uniref:Sialate O-acetylesterase domain-containing protein n=1 Tax=Blastopirellula marina TaxID=124 RepID=A0A2S8GR30_9BACT|nr:sialate O-acetylesterase [Blastopirellula marina]PQO46883.1 hypothetical protein C5Y93_06955 [Blastopirellula marina]
MIVRLLSALVIAALAMQTSFAADKPLKVFILVGQSNMQGHAETRTLEHMGQDPRTAPLRDKMLDKNGEPKTIDDVWISYLTDSGERQGPLTVGYGATEKKIGPELAFGIVMHEKLQEPILLIKTAWGGKSLNTDFRPPSAGEYEFPEETVKLFERNKIDLAAKQAARKEATGKYYKLMVDHVKKVLADIGKVDPDYDPQQGYELAGLVWFQGWNDMVDRDTYPSREQANGYGAYGEVMADFIRDVRKDFSAPNMPVVIGVIGVGGPTSEYVDGAVRYQKVHQNIRDAMASPAEMPEFKGTVAAVLTENYWDKELRDLKIREGKLNDQLKKLQAEKQLSRQEQNAERDRLFQEEFSEQEQAALKNGISNQEYHYLGSAKILSGIGEGFAEAMLQMQDAPADTSK